MAGGGARDDDGLSDTRRMPLDILVLGGTVFLGRHLVEALVARGHRVTTFNRGTRPEAHAAVRSLHGDRDGGLAALETVVREERAGRPWDAVIDTSGYLPRVVRQSCELLARHTRRCVFVSSISVYAGFQQPRQDESATLAEAPPASAPDAEDVARHYGALKAACERVVSECMGADATLLVRPGLIVGPHDPTGRFTYWARRFGEGGRILVPGPADRPVQFIDVRDLARWMLDAVEGGVHGAFNVTGPVGGIDFARFVEAGIGSSGVAADPVWVDSRFLRDEGVKPWMELPLWLGDDMPGMLDVDIGAAVRTGLVTRSVEQTLADTRAWARAAGEADGRQRAGLAAERERKLLARWSGA
jgi:2'-hydroxyisoflavone reductase